MWPPCIRWIVSSLRFSMWQLLYHMVLRFLPTMAHLCDMAVIKSGQKEITLPSKRSSLCHSCDEVVIIYWFPCGKDFKESAPYSRKTPSTVGMKVCHKSSDQPCHQLQTTSPFRVHPCTTHSWSMSHFWIQNPTFNRGSRVARGVISTPGHRKYCKNAQHCPAVYFPLILVRIPYLKVIHFWNDSLYFEPSLGSWLAPQPKIGHGFGEWPLWRIPKLRRFSAFLWAYTCLLFNHLI